MKAQTATKYQLRVNRSSVHISGIAERTPVSKDGLTYAQSACGALTRSYNFAEKQASDDIAEALRIAELHAKVSGRKMCKNCQTAAQLLIDVEAESERLAALEADWAKIEESCSEFGSERWHAMMGGSENADLTMEERGYGYGEQHGTEHRAEWLECAIAGAQSNLDEIRPAEVFSYPAPDGVTITVAEDGSGDLLVTVTVPAKVVLKHLGQRAANAARAYVKSVGEASPVTRTGHSVGVSADKRSDVHQYWYAF